MDTANGINELITEDVEHEINGNGNIFHPNLSLKKPSEIAKVRLLEQTVCEGTAQDLTAVLETYQNFEITARALGIAARYRGAEFVDILEKHGASFSFGSGEGTLNRKYKCTQMAGGGNYRTEYYLMVIPQTSGCEFSTSYSPWYGIPELSPQLPENIQELSLEERVEVAKLFMERKNLNVSMEELLYWSLVLGETEFADALLDMGVIFRDGKPPYYGNWHWDPEPTYLKLITEGDHSAYWVIHINFLATLKQERVLPVMERFQTLAQKEGKKFLITQKLFDVIHWSDKAFAFAINNLDISKINKKQSLERAVSEDAVKALTAMADAGWLADRKRREELIAFAQKGRYTEALAWLIDFKNRTVDLAAEEQKEEEKMFRELMEDPNSVSALSKKWGYKKKEDGTLLIISYKGSDTEVEIPAQIGRAKVTSVGRRAFYCHSLQDNLNAFDRRVSLARSKITSVVVPEGVTELGDEAFGKCAALETISLPSTLTSVGRYCFEKCGSLKNITFPADVENLDKHTFEGCDSLYDQDGFLIVNGILYGYRDTPAKNRTVRIPAGVTAIAENAFYYNNDLETVVIPESVKQIEEDAFNSCDSLRNIYIPATVEKLGKAILGYTFGYGGYRGYYESRNKYINVYTPPGSVAEKLLKTQYSRIHICYDYTSTEPKG